jgi:methyltransferase of ATP-grasp peptide maturase system
VRSPTDLSPAEQARAGARLVEMAERFTERGELCTPAWREVFERTWRHPYVPAYHPDRDTAAVLCLGASRAEWLDAVYSDTTLLTKLMPIPLDRAFRPAMTTMYTSSSTLPSLVLSMLERLDVAEGHRVLEVGTGSGYNAALLCERLGSAQVTSVDIDPELVDLARERLAANGYTPTLAAVDGQHGYPDGAPYDRVISTCAVPAVPRAWLSQAAPGAVILTDVHGLFGGTLVRLTVDEHGRASGRFVPHWAGFMDLRHDVHPAAHDPWPWLTPGDEQRSWTTINPSPILAPGLFGFVLQWQVPDTTYGPSTDEDGQPTVLLHGRDGSVAEVATTPTARGYLVRQYGERRLWDQVEEAAEFWDSEGQPSYERFGITATTEDQFVWYDDPHGPRRWPLTQPDTDDLVASPSR